MYKKQFDLSEVIIMPISKLLPSRSNKGRTGLKNLGNTCFMNSPIQCLSHCEDLTKYFLLQKFKEEINKKTKYGSGGSIATAYYSLIKEIWTGNLDYLSPWDFREIFVSFVRQFAGFIQHDSHEMLTFMLDTLHEDLNRIKEKPYQEINEKGLHEDDATAAARWWTSHLKRENSIIVDLFHGQYKSVITCPQCKRVSVTYDPFMCLSLPIPSSSMQVDLYVKLTEGFAFVRVDYKEGSTVSDVKRKVIEMLCDLNGRFGHCVDLFGSIERKSEEIQLVSVIMKSDTKTVRQIDSDRLLLSNIYENFYELALYELTAEEISRVLSTEDSSRINTRNLVFIQTAKSSNDENPLSYPLLLALNNKETTSDFRKRSLESFIKLADISNKENTLKMQILEESSELQILPNIPEKLKPKYPDCEFCNSSDCTGCLLPLSDSPMRSLISKQNLERPFILTLRLNESLSDQVCRITDIQMNATKRSKSKPRSKRLNIYDCLDFFSETEKLEKENTWYCNVCKEHQEAFKAMYIYKSPMYLIIQLKRFKVRSANSLVGSLLNRKNEALVDFPIVGLDLSNYIKASSENSVYDLIGVSQHYGNMGGGHYTATCRQDSDTWVLFDDTATSVISKDRVVDRSAYLLFYRKRLNSK